MTFIANGKHRSWFSVSAVSASALALLLSTAGVAAAPPPPKTPNTVYFDSASYVVTEGQGSACITVDRSVTKGKSPSVTVVTSDGSAHAGVDYTAVNTTVTFARQQTQVEVCVPILVDKVADEPNEAVDLSLSTSSRGWTVGTQHTATLTIHEMPVPSAPTDLAAEVMSGLSDPYVHLTWTAPDIEPVDDYWIGSSTTSGGPYTELGMTTGTSYDVTPAPSVETYYVVEAVNADMATSAYSNEAVGEGFVPGSGLYWASFSDGTIMAANKDGSGVHTLVDGQADPFGVAVDGSHIYWAAIGADAIMRANLDGTDVTTLVSGQDHPYGVAVDASHVYWTNLQGQTIMEANLDGTDATTLVDGTGTYQPAAIAVDGSHIYWGDIVGAGMIMQADLDGTDVATLVPNQTYPFAIAVDGSHIYWADTGDNTAATGAIVQADLDGNNVTTLVSGQAHPDGIAVDGSHIYWANANDGTIMQADLDGNNVTSLVSGQNLPAGVAVAP
ncbi:MAG: DUF5050 domain-containing protein [Candidatus Limnocylindrales bacterium]